MRQNIIVLSATLDSLIIVLLGTVIIHASAQIKNDKYVH